MAGKAKTPKRKKKAAAPEEDLWFDAAKKLGKAPENMPDYNFRDDNRRTFAIVSSIFAIFLFGAGLWYLYYQKNLGADADVQQFTADSEPVKTLPEDPGGMEVDHQDRLIYDKVTGEETKLEDRVQPTPEQPLDDLADGQTIEDLISETEPEAGTKTATVLPPETGIFIIQLGAYGQQTGAENAWTILEGRYSDILGILTPDIQSMTSGSGQTLYRLRAGYFATRAEAERVCNNLKQRNQDCLATTR